MSEGLATFLKRWNTEALTLICLKASISSLSSDHATKKCSRICVCVCVCRIQSLPYLFESQPSRFTLGEICSTILPPPASLPCWRPAQKVEAEIWVMAKRCAPVTRSSPCVEDRIPAGPLCCRADSLPVRTNAGL